MEEELVLGALAVIRNYGDLHQALRARAEVLKISRPVIDDIAGLQGGYCSKLLSPVPVKHIGPMSLGALLGAMGLKLILVQDDTALKKVQSRIDAATSPRAGMAMAPRVIAGEAMPASGALQPIELRRGNRAWGSMMRLSQLKHQSSAKRVAIAKRAAALRWKYFRKKRAMPAVAA